MSRRVSMPLWVAVAGATALAGFVVTLWSMKRHRHARVDLSDADDISDVLPTLVGATHASLLPGNSIEILQNGRFFDVLLSEFEHATQSITLETYLWKPGRLSRRVVETLAAKAREGVAVRVLIDGAGRKISRSEIRTLREAGCRVARYHPINLMSVGRLNNRDHRKISVVDGRVGFIGGHCVVDMWLGDAGPGEVRDVSVRVRGPIVGELQSAFLENWLEETGEVLAGERFFPRLDSCGDTPAHLVYVSPAGMASSVETLHYVAIAAARKRIRIQNPYFVPDPQLIDSLRAAVDRGVDVRVMVPSARSTDNPVVQHASHHRFGALLQGGIRLFEYQRSLLHQKVMVIDGEWCCIGSSNLDDRSFELNDEATLGIFDERIAAELEEIFDQDLRYAAEYTLKEWKHRSVLHKLLDFTTFAINEQL